MVLLAVGIIVLVIGAGLMVWGALWYMLALDMIEDEQCGENKVKSTTNSGAASITEYYPSCPDPSQGGIVFGAGVAALTGGVVMIIKSRKAVIHRA